MNLDISKLISKIHSQILNEIDQYEQWKLSIVGIDHPLAKETRAEYRDTISELETEKNEFLELASINPLEALLKYNLWLLPDNLGVKHELEVQLV